MEKDNEPHFNERMQLFETAIDSPDGSMYLTHVFTVGEVDVNQPGDRGKVARQAVVRKGIDYWKASGWRNGRITVSRYWPADHSNGHWRQACTTYEYGRARMENGIVYSDD